jgi:hypothetical protein
MEEEEDLAWGILLGPDRKQVVIRFYDKESHDFFSDYYDENVNKMEDIVETSMKTLNPGASKLNNLWKKTIGLDWTSTA